MSEDLRKAVAYLLSLGNEVSAMKLGLENIRALLAELGLTKHRSIKVQIAGTNGKGSVCAFLESICREAGIKTGVFTSPHLVSITERVRIDGRPIDDAAFAAFAAKVRDAAEKLLADGKIGWRPTYFEQMTAIGMAAFTDADVDLIILETGLGGRFDATTAVQADVAAITRIGLDHQEYLGDSIEQIAGEKAAIIGKHTKAAVIGRQSKTVAAVISRRAEAVGVELIRAAEIGDITPGLKGRHQIENAEIAAAVAKVLNELGFAITDANIRRGISSAKHPGRLEKQGRYLFDGAHNLDAADALAAFLSDEQIASLTIIFGAMKDKNAAEMMAKILPFGDRTILTVPANSRSLGYEELAACVPPHIERQRMLVTNDVGRAISAAEYLTPLDGTILITGSLYLVGEAKIKIAERDELEIS